MKIVTKQFGEIQYSEDKLIHFPKGVIAFENCKRYLIINDEDYEPFRWLIAVDEKEIGFPLLNPFLVAPEYGKELPDSLVKKLFSSHELYDIFCVVTLNGEGGHVTINLKSPIIVDYQRKSGDQIILAADDLPVAKPIT